MRHTGKDASLGHGRVTLIFKDAADGNVFMAKSLEEQLASFVIADHTYRQHVHAEVCEVVDGIGAAAEDRLRS